MLQSDVSGRSNLLVNTGDGSYQHYFDELERMNCAAVSWAKTWSNYAFAPSGVHPYLELLGSIFDLLQRRYHFEANDPLMVDRKLSGFPTRYTMTRVKVDRDEERGSELNAHALRDLFLDDLFARGTVNNELRNEIARAEYRTGVQTVATNFDPTFTLCDFSSLERKKSGVKYRVVWGTYNEQRNLPCVHSLIFTYRGEDALSDTTSPVFEKLRKILAFESKPYASVSMMAQHIDDAIPDVSPEMLSRVTVGPLFMPGITTQDDVWTPFLERFGGEDDFLLEIIVDHLYAKNTTKPHFLSGLGIGQQHPRVVFAINRHDQLCNDRGASAVERFVCLTHHLARVIHNEAHGLPADALKGIQLITHNTEGDTL